MNVYTNSRARPESRRFETTPAAPPEGAADTIDTNNTITCVEDRALFDHIRTMVYQQFQPSTPFERLLADEVTEEIWNKQRLGALATHALSFKIEEDWDKISERYPNADNAFRSLRAWQDIIATPGFFRSYDLQGSHWRRRREAARDLVKTIRER